ncbi:MAG TPA: hypothetical protein VN841_20560 [Bryobacteraceae bacterium]|nr:hypothetical protein [Bryobacteraceae bacterium]
MKKQFTWWPRTLAGVVLISTFASAAFGQGAYNAPRTWDNQPDLQGIWQAIGPASLNIEPHTASTGVPGGLGIVSDPADGNIPYLPAALAKRQENARNPVNDPVNRCFMPGVPRFVYMPYPFQIFQTAKQVTLTSEYVHGTRNVFLGGEHLDGVDFYNGDSRGHWEGDTLVVDVADFNDQTWFDRAGNYHSDALHVTERFTRVSPDVLNYEATIQDPKVFSKPWKIAMPLYRHQEKNFRILEYECRAYIEDAGKAGKE